MLSCIVLCAIKELNIIIIYIIYLYMYVLLNCRMNSNSTQFNSFPFKRNNSVK